ncbi:hypothetical protein NDU88_002923 [Pleurodeles waltl]|uniref:Uncharacterized protein n=1 Tax=Pleurodeles waltl TaxID=8319 RepID=A0AAV7TN97_PLEWA|nr:hypothetical protein NDU88_002923 [Pleurodeles waltl]
MQGTESEQASTEGSSGGAAAIDLAQLEWVEEEVQSENDVELQFLEPKMPSGARVRNREAGEEISIRLDKGAQGQFRNQEHVVEQVCGQVVDLISMYDNFSSSK